MRSAKPVAKEASGLDADVAAFQQRLSVQASPRTTEAYLRDLAVLQRHAGETPLSALSSAQLRRFLAREHARGLDGRSLARMLSAWRRFYRFLGEQRPELDIDPCAGLRAPKAVRRLPNALSPDEATRLVEVPVVDAMSARDRAMCELFYSSGLRLSELVGLAPDQLDLADATVKVLGKGRKERIVPVGEPAVAALREWLKFRSELPVLAEADALFVNHRGKRLTPRGIQQRLQVLAVKQGLSRHVHPHMLRHSFASHVLQSSGDLRAVQELLGHASIAATQVYTHLDFQYLAGIYDRAHPRAKRRSTPGDGAEG